MPGGLLMPGDGRDEVRYRFGFLALIQLCRHVAVAACATFGDRVQHQRPATGFGRDLRAKPDVEVGPGAAHGVGPRERMTESTGVGEEHATVLLLSVQLDPADRFAGL